MLAPSVIESPSATTEPTVSFASTLTASRNHHEVVLVKPVVVDLARAVAAVGRGQYEVCLPLEW